MAKASPRAKKDDGQAQYVRHQGLVRGIGGGGEGGKKRCGPAEMSMDEPGQRMVKKQDKQGAGRQREGREVEELAKRHGNSVKS